MLQSVKDLRSDGGSLRKPPDQLANVNGEWYCGPRELNDDVPGVEVEEVVAVLAIPSGA